LYLEQLTVLPPGEWDPNIRLDPPEKLLSKVCTFSFSNFLQHHLSSQEKSEFIRIKNKLSG
jgi:hypothetical protein